MKRKNRNVAAEILEGLKEFKAHREGKLTLRTTTIEPRPMLQVTAEFIRNLRERLNVSRGVLARRLRIHTRTLEKWEQSAAPIKTPLGVLRYATPEVTALELVGYPKHAGGLSNVATIVGEQAKSFTPLRRAAAIASAKRSAKWKIIINAEVEPDA